MPHFLIIIPGLGDRASLLEFATRNWEQKYTIKTIVHPIPWQGTEQEFGLKLERLIAIIDTSIGNGYRVSLLGTSAGGSAVINAFAMRKGKIHRVINVCGRLRRGGNVSPTLEEASRKNKSFYDSVILCENNLNSLTPDEEKKILTFRPLFDELVPSSTVTVSGGMNILMPTIEHVLSISVAITVFANKIVDFVLKE